MHSNEISSWNPAQVLLLGDTHGDEPSVESAFTKASDLNIGVIVQLGDFGYWPHNKGSEGFLGLVEDLTEDTGIKFLWIDGNHENHEQINAMYEMMDDPDTQFWGLTDRFVHARRGARWEWSDRKFLACGGAYSVDKTYRTPRFDWFHEETISVTDVEACGYDKTDVLFSHDAPPYTPNVLGKGDPGGSDGRFPASWNNRIVLGTIIENTRPELVCHGHYHWRNTSESALGPRVEGFGCNGNKDLGILHVSPLKVTDIQ